MVKDAASLPKNPAELRATAANLIELVKSQALQIEKLKHELAGHRRHRFGTKSEALEQLELALEGEPLFAIGSRTMGERDRRRVDGGRRPDR